MISIRQTLRDWSLPIAMIAGVLIYFAYINIPFLDSTHAAARSTVAVVQPLLIFSMLFITFCKVRIGELRIRRWHVWLLAFQILSFIILSLAVAFLPLTAAVRVILESAMLCLLCPTATAAAVITAKLGGSAASLISYTMAINILVAVVAPFFLTLIHPTAGGSFLASFLLISGRVFPLLLAPLLLAEVVRRYLPSLHSLILQRGHNWPFYLWLVALMLAIAVTTRAIVHTHLPMYVMGAIAIVSFVCCVLQFAVGRMVGHYYGETVTGGQALGQKNTVFAIWLAYTFLTPVTAIAGGFYSLWHNIVNTWQLYRCNHTR